jgi:hypothetical protein
MKKALQYLWRRRTTTFGYIQVTLGVLVVSDGIFSPEFLKGIILANAMVLAWLGHYNNRKQKAQPQ